MSRASPNGSSVATNPANLFLTSPNGEAVKSPGSRSGQSAWKTSDNSEDGSVSAAATDSSSTKRAEGGERKPQFDESEELFKPPGDDHFFKVGNSLIDDFNAASGEREQGDPEGLLSAGLVDHESNARMTALLQSASEGERLTGKSFQLLRQSKGTKDQSRDNNNSGIHDNIHHSVDDHGAAKTHGDDDVDGVHQIQSDSSTSPDILSVNGEGRETEHSVVAEVYAEGNSSVLWSWSHLQLGQAVTVMTAMIIPFRWWTQVPLARQWDLVGEKYSGFIIMVVKNTFTALLMLQTKEICVHTPFT